MPTLIAVYNSEGCVGRCDAKCYDASSSKCDCICGGKNHGAGKAAAMANVAERVGLSREDLERFAKERELNPDMLTTLDTRNADMRVARETGCNHAGQPDLFCEAL